MKMKLRVNLLVIMMCICSVLCGQETPESMNNHKSLFDTKLNLDEGTKDWVTNVASMLFDKKIPKNQKNTEFYVVKQDKYLLVQQEIPMMNDNSTQNKILKTCETLKKTCRSEECVADTLVEILGDGTRNVLIKYERKLLSVQIYYTYQDCQK